ncbi:hypothetical protein [Helicobacter sp. MIT 01-3238]|uniref:hypothetical protein n=1 Tax=Helicobacter sp. MIT 01-3238 TaxID=398627 RepID=UPI000E1FAE83|nr:hypothetical protein [Helicobacter sp. MIT 01-3238]RDU55718.1 hypothetical protein CQA40_00400 [Helicobacter sp. MIT 01-3238]
MFELVASLSLFVFVIVSALIIVAKVSKKTPVVIRSGDDFSYEEVITYETIMVTIESEDSTFIDLQDAVKEMFSYYDVLNLSKTQKRLFLFALSKHPNVKSPLVLSALNEMSKRNPDMAKDLDLSVRRGLDRR